MSESSYGTVWRNFMVPVVALLLLLIIYFTRGNQAVFLMFNGLGPLTSDGLWANWTLLGDALVLLVLCLPFVGRRPALVWSLIVTALLAGILVPLLKHAFNLPRPPAVLSADVIHIIGKAFTSRSFPSGHTTAAFAFAGVLSLYFRQAWVMAIAVMIAVGVGVSRMAVGVHWPMDVTAGAALGWSCAVAGVALATRWRWGQSLRGQRIIAVFLVVCAVALLLWFKADSPRAEFLPKGIAVLSVLAALPGFARLWRGDARGD